MPQEKKSYSLTAFKYSIANIVVFLIAISGNFTTIFPFIIVMGGCFSCCGIFYFFKGLKEKGSFGKLFAFVLNFAFLMLFLFFMFGYFVGVH